VVAGVDLRTLPIGPREAFVLSLVDGSCDVDDIVLATGIERDTVQDALRRLRELGAVVFGDGSGPAPRADAAPYREATAAVREPSRIARPVTESVDPACSSAHPSAALYDPAELDEACDLDLDRKKRILDLYYRLDGLDHYALLEVRPDAEKDAIKTAYFRVVGVFHPDKYFGKQLGSFRAKLERVFSRLTEAHDVLTRRRTRQAYDEYLRLQRRVQDLNPSRLGAAAVGAELERARQRLLDAARETGADERKSPRPPAAEASRAAAGARSAPPTRSAEQEQRGGAPAGASPAPRTPDPTATTSDRVSRPPAGAEPRPQSTEATVPSATPVAAGSAPVSRAPGSPSVDPAARRRALARKLGGSMPPPAPSAPPATTEASDRPRPAPADDLLRLYATRVTRARDEQVQIYLDAAELAMKEGNQLSATNALRVALSLAPDRADITQRLAEAEHAAHVAAADGYLEQAASAEKEGQWAEAARSYQRAALGKPTARVHERAAACLLEAQGDLKAALEHARAAVNLAPNAAACRVTLARVYLAADMRNSAIAELERAQALAPQDDTIRGWLKRIRKNQI